MRGEHLQVGGGVRTPLLLVVARDKDWVKVFRAGVIQFIDHPAATHAPIVDQMCLQLPRATAFRGRTDEGGGVTDFALESVGRPPKATAGVVVTRSAMPDACDKSSPSTAN